MRLFWQAGSLGGGLVSAVRGCECRGDRVFRGHKSGKIFNCCDIRLSHLRKKYLQIFGGLLFSNLVDKTEVFYALCKERQDSRNGTPPV